MESAQIRAFYEEHKTKTGKEYRLEFLKLSKEDVYDYLDYIYQDKIHEWRLSLFKSMDNEEKQKLRLTVLAQAILENKIDSDILLLANNIIFTNSLTTSK